MPSRRNAPLNDHIQKQKQIKLTLKPEPLLWPYVPMEGTCTNTFFPRYDELKNFTTFIMQIHHIKSLYRPPVLLLLL